MQIPELIQAVKTRGDATKIARYAGVSESSVSRLLRGDRPNPGVETVAKVKAACARLEKERAAEGSKKADEKQKKSRKSSDSAVAKAGA